MKNRPRTIPAIPASVKIVRKIGFSDGYSIESWYDRHTRSWISQLKDPKGHQVGDAQYDGHRGGVARSQDILTMRWVLVKPEISAAVGTASGTSSATAEGETI